MPLEIVSEPVKGKSKRRVVSRYIYVMCLDCGNVFRVARSSWEHGVWILSYGSGGKWGKELQPIKCSRCSGERLSRTSEKTWKNSNVVVPDVV